MAKARQVTIREAREMQRLYEQEYQSLKQVSARTGWSVTTVRRTLIGQGTRMRKPHRLIRPPKNRTPHQEVLKAVAAYRSGLTLREAAELLGVADSTVSRRLRAAGEPMRSKRESMMRRRQWNQLPVEVEDEIVRLYRDEGMREVQVVQATGRARNTVRKVLKRRGVPPHPRKYTRTS